MIAGSRTFLLLALSLLAPGWVSAYNVSPSLVRLRPSGGEANGFLHLENRGPKPAALEITVQEHRKDLDGKTIAGREIEEDFLIFPAQIVMLPGDEIGVQLRWIGEPKLAAERVYTLVTREVSIPRKEAENDDSGEGIRVAVNVRLNFEVRVYVTPPGAKPKIVVESVTERATGAAPELELVLHNQGTMHQALTAATLLLVVTGAEGATRAFSIPAKEIPALKPHVLAGDRRRVVIPRPAQLPPGAVRVTLSD